jgi:hypothetical protein
LAVEIYCAYFKIRIMKCELLKVSQDFKKICGTFYVIHGKAHLGLLAWINV